MLQLIWHGFDSSYEWKIFLRISCKLSSAFVRKVVITNFRTSTGFGSTIKKVRILLKQLFNFQIIYYNLMEIIFVLYLHIKVSLVVQNN